MRRRQTWHGDRARLEVVNSPHALGTKQFEASGMDAAEQHDRHASIHLHDERRDERH